MEVSLLKGCELFKTKPFGSYQTSKSNYPENGVVFVHFIIQYKNLKIEVNFHASYFFFGELKDQLLSMGGGKGAENFVFRGGRRRDQSSPTKF